MKISSLVLLMMLSGCELLQDNQQREVITFIKFESPDCKLYLQKKLASDASAFEGSFIELDDTFKLDGVEGTEGVVKRIGE